MNKKTPASGMGFFYFIIIGRSVHINILLRYLKVKNLSLLRVEHLIESMLGVYLKAIGILARILYLNCLL
jgi:hypothetical protein